MTLSNRQYIPTIGKSVKLRMFSDYTERNINVWAWLRVLAVNGEDATVEVLNGTERTGHVLSVPLAVIAPPLGWKPRYTIYCKPEQAETIVSNWFTRGIVVRANHAIGDPSGSAFHPMDNATQSHWKYPNITDAIEAADCPKLFRVVAVETEEINHYSDPTHPNMRELGRSKRALVIKALRAEGWKVEYQPYAGGVWTRTRETVVHEFADTLLV